MFLLVCRVVCQCKPCNFGCPYLGGSVYYIILAPLILASLLAEVSSTLK